jgi:hypothetical protein
MEKLNMDYNTTREPLIISEYGRNMQNLINHAKTIEDREKRQVFVEQLVELAMQMIPQSNNQEDYRDRIWKHFFRIANYELDVVPPNGEIPNAEDAAKRPAPMDYPASLPRYRHYGYNVQQLIEQAESMPPGPKRQGFIKAIGSYMKLAYQTWNHEPYVSDEVILADLENMSDGNLTLEGDTPLMKLYQNNPNNGKSGGKGGRSRHKKGGKPSNRGGNNNRKRKRK